MKYKFGLYSKSSIIIQAAFIMSWISNLAHTDAMFSVYAFCCIIGIFSLCDNYSKQCRRDSFEYLLVLAMSVLFSIATIISNYAIFSPLTDLLILFNLGCSFIGGTILSFNVLLAILKRIPISCVTSHVDISSYCHIKVFTLSFLSISFINLVHLFLVEYPGNITIDSLSQIDQILSGVYVNHHPYWHTVVIGFFFKLGYFLFHDYNAAVALYGVGQIVFMAACFSYAVVTLYQSTVSRSVCFVVWCVYALMPYNIAYSICMNKDVIFSGAVLCMITSLYRLLCNIGSKRFISYILFVLSGIGVCIWRSNGILAFAFSLVVFTVFFWRNHRFLLYTMCAVTVFSWFLTRPFLTYMNVSQTDLVESLSIPVQQVARVVHDNCLLTDEQFELLDTVVDVNEVPELYVDWLSDPIKDEIRSKNPAYFEGNISAYFRLWLELGLRYPAEYMKAWIDQTKGYWNAGYDYNPYSLGVSNNTLGITEGANDNIIAKVSHGLFKVSRGALFMEPFESVGLHVWLLVILLFCNAMKRRIEFVLTIPALAIILSLLVATPVSYAFRYAYPVFLCCPFVSAVTLYQHRD